MVPVLNIEHSMNYPDFQLQLSRLHVETDVPEVHGQLCGLLCTCRAEKAKTHWFATVLDNLKSRPGLLTENAAESRVALQELDEVFTSTRDQLNSEDFGFELFLDPSPHQMIDRMTDLAAWCNGFVFGFGIGLGEQKAALPEDTAELISDFQTIAAYESDDGEAAGPASAEVMDAADQGSADQDEGDVTEIEEFIRVGVLLIAEEMRATSHVSASANATAAVHSGAELDLDDHVNGNSGDDEPAPTLH